MGNYVVDGGKYGHKLPLKTSINICS